MDEWKTCRLCREPKQAEDFACRTGRATRQSYCRECYRQYASRWGKSRPPRKKAEPSEAAQ